jgi:hypothetical protein
MDGIKYLCTIRGRTTREEKHETIQPKNDCMHYHVYYRSLFVVLIRSARHRRQQTTDASRGNITEQYTSTFTIDYAYDDLNRIIAGLLPKGATETARGCINLEYDKLEYINTPGCIQFVEEL